jgi:hypothetical protein
VSATGLELDHLLEALHPKEGSLRIAGLGQPVGIEDKKIARLQVHLVLIVVFGFEKANGHVVPLQEGPSVFRGAISQRLRVAAIHVGYATGRKIEAGIAQR